MPRVAPEVEGLFESLLSALPSWRYWLVFALAVYWVLQGYAEGAALPLAGWIPAPALILYLDGLCRQLAGILQLVFPSMLLLGAALTFARQRTSR